MKSVSAVTIVILALSLGENAEASDLPEDPNEGHFKDLLSASPFLRTLDPTATYRLRGLATIAGHPVATLFNQKTDETRLVTDEGPNEWGLKLVEVTASDQLTGVSVRLEMGGEEFELKYEAERIAPGSQNGGKKQKVQYDSKGRAIPPPDLINNYKSMSDAQRKKYWEWRTRYYEKRPKLKDSPDRFPIVEKAINAIKQGKEPPKP